MTEILTAHASQLVQAKVAGSLARRGIGSGSRIVFVTTSGADMLSAILGALRVGIIPVVLNTALLAHERDALIADARPSLVVDDRLLAELVEGPVADLADVPLARPMHYTSGTTGTPKGVWSGVLAEDDARRLFDEERELWGFDGADRHLVCSPLHHSAPIRFSGTTLLVGGDVVLPGPFDARRVASAIDETRPTTTFVVPAHLQRLLRGGHHGDLSSFRLVAHAGAPCPAPLKLEAIEAFPGDSVWEFYGSTEGQFTVCDPGEWLDNPGTVGRARPNRVLSVDDDGVIWCEVPKWARFSYWDDPDRTSAAWSPPGAEVGSAFSVGDIGRLDGQGRLWLDGRRDDLIITGGVNVYPLEVEKALVDLPGVDQVVVFGVEDDRWGHRVCAAVVGDVAPDDLMVFARTRLAAYKCPKEIHVVDEIPHTSTGKVRRSAMAAHLGLESGP